MAGGSLRNSIHRRNHKERSQLSNRTKLGLLEKHKDYVRRAKDYHSKQDRIKRLQEKAAERNKDEFYFSMNKVKTQAGVHIQDRGNKALPVEVVKVLKSQDANYIRTVRNTGRKRIANLKGQLASLADLFPVNSEIQGLETSELEDDELVVLQEAGVLPPSQRSSKGTTSTKHVLFVDSADELKFYTPGRSQPALIPPPAQTEPPELGWIPLEPSQKSKGKRTATRPNAAPEASPADIELQSSTTKKQLLKELSARMKRDTSLKYTLVELETQRLMMGRGGHKKIRDREKVGEDGNSDEERTPTMSEYRPKVYKWRTERKR